MYENVHHLLAIHQTELLVISSNPLLLDQECFVKMLWSLFHLMDEFRLRGDFAHLDPRDIAHMNVDFKRSFKLLLKNYTANNIFLKEEYPSYYHAAITKLRQNS